jgi:hypothetical protein
LLIWRIGGSGGGWNETLRLWLRLDGRRPIELLIGVGASVAFHLGLSVTRQLR